ncbi:hypothetical protein QP173_06370, partial [Aerococcus urinae]
MCRKKVKVIIEIIFFSGSPPHVREKVSKSSFCCSALGITPACAGKSLQLVGCLRHYRDHPRMCGKKYVLAQRGLRKPGSPPHVREKVYNHRRLDNLVGITPACAGKRLKDPYQIKLCNS